jgi:hypothetical protein
MDGNLMTEQPDQIRQHTLTIVQNAQKWELPAARWEVIAAVLAVLLQALDQGNLDAVAEAAIQLELAGPTRITKIGAPAKPAPPPVRERLNETVTKLTKVSGEDDKN